MKKVLFSCLFGLILLMVACNVKYFEGAEFGEITFDPTLAVLFGELTYTVDDLFRQLNTDNADINSNDENVVTLGFQQTLQSESASDFLSVLDQNFQGTLLGGTNLNNPSTSTKIRVSETYEYDLRQQDDEEVDSIYFNSGDFIFSIQSDFNTKIDFITTFRSLEENGQPLEISGSLTPNNNSITTNSALSDYVGLFHLDANGNQATNKFVIDIVYDIIVEPGNSVSESNQVAFDVETRSAQFERVYGDFGAKELEISVDNIEFGFFEQFVGDGRISFVDPQFSFIFDNSFGFPLGIDFQRIAVVAKDGSTINLEGEIINQLNAVAGPRVINEGIVRTTEIKMTSSNSNINELLSARPETLIVDVRASANPAGFNNQYNFVNTSSLLNVGVDVEIPLDVIIDGLTVIETLPFTPPENLDQANRLLLRLISENQLPLSGIVGIEFLNNSGNVVQSLDAQGVFTAAELGPDGRTVEPTRDISDFILDSSDLDQIENASEIRLIVTLSTTDASQETNVKLFDDYELKFKVAGQLELNFTSTGN